ncbi:protein D2-like isoform X2 [Planococcus citri]|uniref:protein D2-like isoform X2 n=1 Tax=Planococcus citri TaxID=170843 RepID=UPI0031F8219B
MLYILLPLIAITTIIFTNAAVYDYKAVEISGLSGIEVYWDFCVRANLGNRHRRWYTAFKSPRVTWNGDEDALYTLIMHNPDVPIGNFSFRRWRPWVVGNIPGPCRVDDGFVLYDYNLDFKPIDAFQRHVFLVYKQEKPITFDHRDVYQPRRLQRFNLTKFVYKYKLGNPEFGNFYYSFLN